MGLMSTLNVASDFPREGFWPTVTIWDVEAGVQVADLKDFTNRIAALAWSSDSQALAVGYGNGGIKVINTGSGLVTRMRNTSSPYPKALNPSGSSHK